MAMLVKLNITSHSNEEIGYFKEQLHVLLKQLIKSHQL